MCQVGSDRSDSRRINLRSLENPAGVTKAEILVGTPSFNEAGTISHVVATVDQGLWEFFPGRKAVIVNADNSSPDGTREAFLNTRTVTPKIYLPTPEGTIGKGENLRNVFLAASHVEAEAVVVVDSDLTSITPRWIEHLAGPLFNGFDYVAPLYVRHKYDAGITNHIACPLTRALYGARIRQPIGGDFGLSGPLVNAYLSEETWSHSVSHYGIDIWMTTVALARGFRICQAFLETGKVHRAKDPGEHLGEMAKQVVAALFDLMGTFEHVWKEVSGSRPTPLFGEDPGSKVRVPAFPLDREKLYDSIAGGLDSFGETWGKILDEEDLSRVTGLLEMSAEDLHFPHRLWARTVYGFAVSYHAGRVPRDHLLQSMIPLNFSRMLSFANQAAKMSAAECERYFEDSYLVFEDEKEYLLSRWTEAARPSPSSFLDSK